MISLEASHINEVWARLLVEELVRQGADTFFLSPGSRCTPLTIAAARNDRTVCHTHFDERAMAFHALGFAKGSGRPAVLVCTSGTAAANYLPAVVEAAQALVPLIVLTADRPPELLDCGANQAIDQPGLYGAYTRWACNLPCPDEEVSPRALLTSVGHAVHRSMGRPPGPVHLNCMYREPLAPADGRRDFSSYLAPVSGWLEDGVPYTQSSVGVSYPDEAFDPVLEAVSNARQGLLVVGELREDGEREAVRKLASHLGWPAVPDVLSGLRLSCPGAPWLPYFDQLLQSRAFAERVRPDTVLHLGGPLVSKRLQLFLETFHANYIRVTSHPSRLDPGHLVRHRLVCDIVPFCERLEEATPGMPPPSPPCAALGDAMDEAVDAWLGACETLTEMHVARTVSRQRPAGRVLYLGNSMPIRDMDMFGTSQGALGPVHANRGASGIDGNIATAAGIARAIGSPLVAVMGDLAALHDLNALAMLPELETPFVLVVINNRGGGIFSLLPVSSQRDVFEPYFATPHGFSLASLAEGFGIRTRCPGSPDEFGTALDHALRKAGPTLIEVITDRDENHNLRRALQHRLAECADHGSTS